MTIFERIEKMVNGSEVIQIDKDQLTTWSIGNNGFDGTIDDDRGTTDFLFSKDELTNATIRDNVITFESNGEIVKMKCFVLIPYTETNL